MPDVTDRRILRQLLADPSLPNPELAGRAGVTPASLWRRLERMRETGVIRAIETRIDWRGVKSFVEEKDRFLFLITPALNLVLPKRLLSPEQSTELRALIAEVTVSGRLGTGVDSPPPSSDNPRS